MGFVQPTASKGRLSVVFSALKDNSTFSGIALPQAGSQSRRSGEAARRPHADQYRRKRAGIGSAAAPCWFKIRKREIIIHNYCHFSTIFIIVLYLLLWICDFGASRSCAVTLDATPRGIRTQSRTPVIWPRRLGDPQFEANWRRPPDRSEVLMKNQTIVRSRAGLVLIEEMPGS